MKSLTEKIFSKSHFYNLTTPLCPLLVRLIEGQLYRINQDLVPVFIHLLTESSMVCLEPRSPELNTLRLERVW